MKVRQLIELLEGSEDSNVRIMIRKKQDDVVCVEVCDIVMLDNAKNGDDVMLGVEFYMGSVMINKNQKGVA